MQGDLRFTGLTPWPVTLTAPGIMGWYAFVPYMECYHGVLSLDHRIDGTLALDGQKFDFGGGRGYIEKDWGQFATRTKARIEALELNDYQVTWSMTGHAGDGKRRGRYRLDIVTGRTEGGLLHAPFRDGLQQRVVESLTATAEVRKAIAADFRRSRAACRVGDQR